jgi:hypothetical protein
MEEEDVDVELISIHFLKRISEDNSIIHFNEVYDFKKKWIKVRIFIGPIDLSVSL